MMNTAYLLACGIVWCKGGDDDAGWELLQALRSPDVSVRLIAASLLADAGYRSARLIETALSNGDLTCEEAAPCLLRLQNSSRGGERSPVTTVAA